ncbi:MAG TPA: alpha/beta hydrolase [Solirubrobacterales bacterium]
MSPSLQTSTLGQGELAVEVSHGFADLASCRLHYVSRGEGEPILCLHGFPQFWFLWRRQLADLGNDHAVFAPDMRGYNLSCKPEDPEAYRMRHLLQDVGGLIDELGLAPLTLVGHDWGGIVAWAFALKYPELLERLVIIDGPPPFTWNRDLRESPKQRDAVNYMLEFSKPSPEPEEMLAANDFSLMDDLMVRIGGHGAQLSAAERAAYHEAWAKPGALRGGLNYYRAARMGEQVAAGGVPEEYASKITSQTVEVPTLVIWGANDAALLPSLTRGLSEWVPRLRVEVVPGAGHWVPYERPDVVNSLIREFVPH